MTRMVPRKTMKTTTKWADAVLLLLGLWVAREPPMKLMSFVIFEKLRRIPVEKMSPLSGKYILRIDCAAEEATWNKILENLDWFFMPVKKNWKSWRLRSSSQIESGSGLQTSIVSNRAQDKTLELRAFKKKTIRTIPGLPHICTLLRLFGGRPKCTKKSAIAVVAVRKNQHLTGRLKVHQRKVPPSCIVSRSHLSRLNSAL